MCLSSHIEKLLHYIDNVVIYNLALIVLFSVQYFQADENEQCSNVFL